MYIYRLMDPRIAAIESKIEKQDYLDKCHFCDLVTARREFINAVDTAIEEAYRKEKLRQAFELIAGLNI